MKPLESNVRVFGHNHRLVIEPVKPSKSKGTFIGHDRFAAYLLVNVSTEEREVILAPFTKYKITVLSDSGFTIIVKTSAVEVLKHVTLEYSPYTYETYALYGCVLADIFYKTIVPQ